MEEWSEKCNIAGFEHDRRPQAKEYGWPLKIGKGTQPSDILILA